MNKRLWIVLAVLVVGTMGSLIWWKSSKETVSEYWKYLDQSKLITVDDVVAAKIKDASERGINDFKLSDDDKKIIIPDHYIGKKDSRVIVLQYEDFACSHCAEKASTFNKIMDDYQDRVLFIYRHFSLNFPNSTTSISASEAAYLLGGEAAFWKMHKILFQDDSTWTTRRVVSRDEQRELFSDFATATEINLDKLFETMRDYKGNGISDKIERDRQLGHATAEAAGIDRDKLGTPMWFVNGQKVDVTNEDIRKAIDEALKSAD
ncbi:DsbA family protein [Candidatus Saccharibacteria bacterium]|nr:DsbA family protein [Candidatus Saccharibacteria bacterium]